MAYVKGTSHVGGRQNLQYMSNLVNLLTLFFCLTISMKTQEVSLEQYDTHNHKWRFGAVSICQEEPHFLPPLIPPKSASTENMKKLQVQFRGELIMKRTTHSRFLYSSWIVDFCHLTSHPFLLSKWSLWVLCIFIFLIIKPHNLLFTRLRSTRTCLLLLDDFNFFFLNE